jgi:LacI family transcriptional regulator
LVADRNTRLVDVAEAAGVSLATASRALAGSERVNPELAARVREAAASLGYVPNAYARTLAGQTPPMVGLVVHDVTDPYFAEIAKGVLRVADEHDLMVLIHQSERRPELELARVRTLRNYRVASVVLTGSGYVDAAAEMEVAAELAAFQATGGRVAIVGRHHIPVDAVLPDNQPGGATAMRHLLDLGHRHIGVVAGTETLSTVADRLAGARDAMTAAGLRPQSLVIEFDEFSRDGGIAATHRLLSRAPDITAIMAVTDVMAIGVLEVLREHALAVPGHISVIGFDDISVAADLAPALTTIRLPMADMGATALEMTLREPTARPRRRRTGHELITRASTATPR